MHIVFLTNEYPKGNEAHGGIGTFVQNLARNLYLRGIRVSVVGINKIYSEVEIDEGVTVYRIQQSKARVGKFVFNSLRIRRILEKIHSENSIDIVEGSELSFAFLAKKTAYKKVIRMHGGHHFFAVTLNKKPALWRSFQEKTSFKKVDALIAVSDYVGKTTSKLLNLKMPYKTIYNFIDLKRFKPSNQVDVKKNSIVFIGTICEKKGVKQLVEAFPIIKTKIPNVTLHIIGRDWKSTEIPSYIEFLKGSIAEKHKEAIKFRGTVSQKLIPSVIEKAHVCVFPSHMESFGLTVVEAMAMEKAIVYSNIPPFNEIITDNYSGLACNQLEANNIANKVVTLLTNGGLATKMSKNARIEVESKFDEIKLVKENINFYKHLIQ